MSAPIVPNDVSGESTASRSRGSNLFSRLPISLRHRVIFLAAGNLVLMGFILLHSLRTGSASFSNELSQLAPNFAPLLLAGLGLSGIIFAGAIDLSIGSIVVVAGTVFGVLYERGAPPMTCFVACSLTAWVLSTVNGFAIRLLNVPAIIVTLAGLTFYRGLAIFLARWLVMGNTEQITANEPDYQTPAKEFALPIMLVGFGAALLLEAYGKLPRLWLAHGSSPEACRLQGIAPHHLVQSAFLAGGVFLGLSALVQVTNLNTIEPSRTALGFELAVIGGVVLGGTSIFGGEGSYLGTALGMLFLYWVEKTLIYAGVRVDWQVAVRGAVVVAVIGFDCAMHRRKKLLDELQ